jgi:carbon storage regulator
MLVLSRRVEEEIVIDGQIRIKVLTNSRGKVRLGISAPDHVRIERSELLPLRTIECLSPPPPVDRPIGRGDPSIAGHRIGRGGNAADGTAGVIPLRFQIRWLGVARRQSRLFGSRVSLLGRGGGRE